MSVSAEPVVAKQYGFSVGVGTAGDKSIHACVMTKCVTSKRQHLFVVITRLLLSTVRITRTHNAAVECHEISQ